MAADPEAALRPGDDVSDARWVRVSELPALGGAAAAGGVGGKGVRRGAAQRGARRRLRHALAGRRCRPLTSPPFAPRARTETLVVNCARLAREAVERFDLTGRAP